MNTFTIIYFNGEESKIGFVEIANTIIDPEQQRMALIEAMTAKYGDNVIFEKNLGLTGDELIRHWFSLSYPDPLHLIQVEAGFRFFPDYCLLAADYYYSSYILLFFGSPWRDFR